MADPDNAGPYDVGPDEPLDPDESETLRFESVRAGPADKRGYLTKLYGRESGLDYVFVVNASGEPVRIDTRGGSTLVPPATSQSIDSGGYRSVTVTNVGGATVNDSNGNQVSVQVGNGPRDGNEQTGFSVGQAAEDLIPGFSSGGG